jgi:3-hydroxyisobutyrate dehydrogenase-like beta-hydroxyacid dehydrogenase
MLGAGRMGSAIARTLARAGGRLVVYNRTPGRATDLAALIGGETAATPAEVASRVDVLLSSVADDEALTALYRGPDGVLGGLTARTVAVDLSTILPATIRDLADDVRQRGAGLLDAPVSGSVATAEAGRLMIMVGGEAADLERARPVLEAAAARVIHVGDLGAGATVKLAVNAIVMSLNGALAEALVLAERAGVPRALAYEVFASSAVGAPFVQYKQAAFVDPDGTAPAFSIGLAQKDLRLILALADQVEAQMPQTRANLGVLEEAGRAVGAERDFSEVATHLRSRVGSRTQTA